VSWTCTHDVLADTFACSLDSLDYVGVLLQVVAFSAGCVLALGAALALYLVLRTMTERDS
jgi:hypothetical protein